MYDIRNVKNAARNMWPSIISALAPELEPAIERVGRHVPCPFHPGKSGDGFRLFKDFDTTGGGCCNTCGAFPDGIALLMFAKDWEFKEALEAVAKQLGVEPESAGNTRQRADEASERKAKDKRIRQRIRMIWNEALPLDEPGAEPARLYLARRGLVNLNPSPELRFHPALPYWHEGERLGTHPALVARFSDSTEQGITLHCIFLDAVGRKADVPVVKKTLGLPSKTTMNGGSVKLFDVDQPYMGCCEGVETALAIREATGMPVWATLTANLLAQVEVPATVTDVAFWTDLDPGAAGEKAAADGKARMWKQHKRAVILAPEPHWLKDRERVDWLNVYNEAGPDAFPVKARA